MLLFGASRTCILTHICDAHAMCASPPPPFAQTKANALKVAEPPPDMVYTGCRLRATSPSDWAKWPRVEEHHVDVYLVRGWQAQQTTDRPRTRRTAPLNVCKRQSTWFQELKQRLASHKAAQGTACHFQPMTGVDVRGGGAPPAKMTNYELQNSADRKGPPQGGWKRGGGVPQHRPP